MIAVEFNFSQQCLAKLIELGCDINAQDKDGMTALHKSIWCESKDNFKLLVDKGADLDLKDNEGESCRDLVEEDENSAFKSAL